MTVFSPPDQRRLRQGSPITMTAYLATTKIHHLVFDEEEDEPIGAYSQTVADYTGFDAEIETIEEWRLVQ